MAFRARTSLPPRIALNAGLRRGFSRRCSSSSALFRPEALSVFELEAPTLGISSDSAHVDFINSRLVADGILKIRLGFSDEKSQYLEQIIRQLHTNHGHGLPITHSASRGWFWDVRPTTPFQQSTISASSSAMPTSTQARSETMEEFPWHTDCSYELSPPRYFALHVLHHDRCNGGTTSILRVKELLQSLSPGTKYALSRPDFRIEVPPEFTKNGNERYITSSLLQEPSLTPMNPQLRFRQDIITPLTTDATKALQELKAGFEKIEVQKAILHLTPELLPKGSIILIDNRRWLHARKYASSTCHT
ncbi:hypothetical protein LARI1_G006430 [Lachnellula arida]|uniref:TauD/TfdA-like domain-containing protein n=1 Tax=Lachnellula arida TaxID=1316785 RepID=A0A8T9BAU9_9HELO|nr:hypothetical protein LARI1_G006430 [Lachnellula arida]